MTDPMWTQVQSSTFGTDECGVTRIETTVFRAPFRVGPDSPAEIERTDLYRCVRERDHEGRHFGVIVYKDEQSLLWLDELAATTDSHEPSDG